MITEREVFTSEFHTRLANIEMILADLQCRINAVVSNSLVPEKQKLTLKQAAEFLNMAKSTLYAKVRLGKIPHNKPEGRLYFFEDELTEWIQKGRRMTKAEIQTEARKGLRRG